MKTSTRTYLERKADRLSIGFSAEGYAEHGVLPGIIDLAEYLDILQLHEKAKLDEEGHRVPVTILALDTHTASLGTAEFVMETKVDGPFYAMWSADGGELEFVVVADELEGMKALRDIYQAALAGRVFADFSRRRSYGGLKLVAIEDAMGRSA
ncbi:hypothetical protein HFO56_00365 [Rhizobium laguerreae]|uniref:hypothetical protein n=1 Tax=Rhizobium laguerreae TaxID=1076926 RepID=UPI001C91418A|nr:hypothetical protein [Rhizobium laguerreae]MBY3150881.1 hypothetical protein [Rhizobium laguerreae]